MKYRVIGVMDDDQHVIVETDELFIACMIADTIEKYPTFEKVFIEKENES